MRKILVASSSLVLASALLASCASEEPQNDAPVEWTEESAFAAAEETYRAFIEATMPYGDELALEYLAGDFRAREAQAMQEYRERGIELSGESIVTSFDGVDFSLIGGSASVTAHACHDDSDTWIKLPDGEPESAREEPLYQAEIEFVSVDGELRITSMTERAEPKC
ncbi:hypothetical protein [Microbacterium amylolyticum]|uniref:Lipoprotein n=1 Tax=Microbacterium amylolyticum TaxID=936337 RepID=A0ABS4ZFP8_9MICO|nr:hypothetical protein [Microbacterium amylolyticum]MBP2435833.1 hypothetical protein [Microbacterium amylolyticum]